MLIYLHLSGIVRTSNPNWVILSFKPTAEAQYAVKNTNDHHSPPRITEEWWVFTSWLQPQLFVCQLHCCLTFFFFGPFDSMQNKMKLQDLFIMSLSSLFHHNYHELSLMINLNHCVKRMIPRKDGRPDSWWRRSSVPWSRRSTLCCWSRLRWRCRRRWTGSWSRCMWDQTERSEKEPQTSHMTDDMFV